MSSDDWKERRQEVQGDLAASEQSSGRGREQDVRSLRDYVQWLRGKEIKAMIREVAEASAKQI